MSHFVAASDDKIRLYPSVHTVGSIAVTWLLLDIIDVSFRFSFFRFYSLLAREDISDPNDMESVVSSHKRRKKQRIKSAIQFGFFLNGYISIFIYWWFRFSLLRVFFSCTRLIYRTIWMQKATEDRNRDYSEICDIMIIRCFTSKITTGTLCHEPIYADAEHAH